MLHFVLESALLLSITLVFSSVASHAGRGGTGDGGGIFALVLSGLVWAGVWHLAGKSDGASYLGFLAAIITFFLVAGNLKLFIFLIASAGAGAYIYVKYFKK